MKTSNGTHAYRRKCIAGALDLADSVPHPIRRRLPRDGAGDAPNLPPDQLDRQERPSECPPSSAVRRLERAGRHNPSKVP
jgi:hypothetical protein